MGTFHFKQFDVDDTGCGMKVGTDSVILGSWTTLPDTGSRPARVLDIGTGCGILALMIAQRFPTAHITGIEIDPAAVVAAERNFIASPWSDRLKVVCGDIMTPGTVAGKYDLVISNPPFFKETTHSDEARRSLARHGDGFDVITLVRLAPELLYDGGVLAFVAPESRSGEIPFEATMARLEPVATCTVAQRPGRPVVRRLFLFSMRGDRISTGKLPAEIVINDASGKPDLLYRNLTAAFYLNL